MISEDPARDGSNWYAYANNSPLVFVDKNGLQPTAMEAALMAMYIYDGKSGAVLQGGWTQTSYYDTTPKGGGLQMAVYQRATDSGSLEYSIVNAGTAKPFVTDWIENLKQLFGASQDMKDSIEFSRNFVKANPDAETTMVGHSKGGAEAAGNALATGTNAILFNPAAINASAYGLDTKSYSGSMTVFTVIGEILSAVESWFSKPIDKKVDLPTQSTDPVVNHLMPSVIEGLEESGY